MSVFLFFKIENNVGVFIGVMIIKNYLRIFSSCNSKKSKIFVINVGKEKNKIICICIWDYYVVRKFKKFYWKIIRIYRKSIRVYKINIR